MKSFTDFIADTRSAHTHVNFLFERSMYTLINDLEQIVRVMCAAGLPFEGIGGVAVNAHLLEAHRSR